MNQRLLQFSIASCRVAALTLCALGGMVAQADEKDARTKFDGAWQTTLSCVNSSGALGYSFKFPASIEHGVLHGQKGNPQEAGWLSIDGPIGPDGVADLYVDGLVGASAAAVGQRPAGSQYGYHVAARFSADRAEGHRVEGRPCTVLFERDLQGGGPPARHSLESDYGFMIGRWKCHVTQAGTPDQDISVEYEWAYDKHVLRENMRLGSTLTGEFLTTYDKATDRFKGVGVGAWGYVVWENFGFHEGHLSERGFLFDSGKMTPVSRSEFERVNDNHYVVRDFEADTAAGSGKATDTEDCIKVR